MQSVEVTPSITRNPLFDTSEAAGKFATRIPSRMLIEFGSMPRIGLFPLVVNVNGGATCTVLFAGGAVPV